MRSPVGVLFWRVVAGNKSTQSATWRVISFRWIRCSNNFGAKSEESHRSLARGETRLLLLSSSSLYACRVFSNLISFQETKLKHEVSWFKKSLSAAVLSLQAAELRVCCGVWSGVRMNQPVNKLLQEVLKKESKLACDDAVTRHSHTVLRKAAVIDVTLSNSLPPLCEPFCVRGALTLWRCLHWVFKFYRYFLQCASKFFKGAHTCVCGCLVVFCFPDAGWG